MKVKMPPMYDIPEGVKPVNTLMFAVQVARGGVVFSAEAAIRIAELLCEVHHGVEEMAAQRPFVATDKGTCWRVEGSRNRPKTVDGIGPFFLTIDKHDGRVTEIGHTYDYTPDLWIIEHVRRMKSGNATDE